MLPLVVGTLLAVGALAYVLYPLFVAAVAVPRRHLATLRERSRSSELEAVAALREIEFDRATGKLSDSDYDELKTRYTARALAAMRIAEPADLADAAEAAIRAVRARMKSCVGCGPRPEPDAAYCSNCGLYLPGVCDSCGAAVTEPGASFCAACGRQLAA
jgi:hypothetical protein